MEQISQTVDPTGPKAEAKTDQELCLSVHKQIGVQSEIPLSVSKRFV